MLKLAAVLASLAIVVVAAFVIVPKVLLKASGTDKPAVDRSVPVGAARATGTPVAGASDKRRVEDFATLASKAGFTPLTPSALPNDYQPWEEYVRQSSTSEVVLTYRKAPDLYVLIDERPYDRTRFRNGRPPGGYQRGSANATPQDPSVDVGGTTGFYYVGRVYNDYRAFGPGSDLSYHNSQPHAVMFFRGDLMIIVEADLNDVPREDLIKLAAGLR